MQRLIAFPKASSTTAHPRERRDMRLKNALRDQMLSIADLS